MASNGMKSLIAAAAMMGLPGAAVVLDRPAFPGIKVKLPPKERRKRDHSKRGRWLGSMKVSQLGLRERKA